MKKFLLVNPWIHDFAAFDFWLKPLGLLRIAGRLRDAGAGVHLLDLLDRNHPWLTKRTGTDKWGRGKFFAEEIPAPDILKYVPRKFKRYGLPRGILKERANDLPDADAILLTSSMTYWYTGVAETIETLRQRYPDTPMILGGIYPTLLPDHAGKRTGADIVVSGSFERNRKYLESMLDLRLPGRPSLPAWELYPELTYAVMNVSKGCPFRCTYCASHLIESRFAARDIGCVLHEFKNLLRLGVKRIAFYDDALLFHPDFDELMQAIIGMQVNLQLHTPNGLHVTEITPQRACLMRQAGFSSIYLSLETTDEKLLASTGPKLSAGAFSKAAKILKNAGFTHDQLHAYVLFGLPEQSEESVRRTLDLAMCTGVTPHLAEFSPVPGTEEYAKAKLADDADPLLTNNTAYCSREDLRDSWHRLKDYLKENNQGKNAGGSA